MKADFPAGLVSLDVLLPIWGRFFAVSPLIVVGSLEENSEWNFAPKHMATPLGWENYFGFACTPEHGTYANIRRNGEFTVTYVRPTQVLLASLAASGREQQGQKPALAALPTFPAKRVAGRFLADGYLFLECELDRIVDGFGANSLIAGKVVEAHIDEDSLRE
ncbi:flavin reductase [Lignipirellula cremea]|uniref:Flavin reductase like domain protein n=1 Tax=Lignipirellula cremea TaxID=2528010 RepID=A0A518E4A8_9BACT|nr:flavin reductase [Lignipirellula cremea]QDU98898.1 Flavin reductase like domain protein [Lignipirellula cremea]